MYYNKEDLTTKEIIKKQVYKTVKVIVSITLLYLFYFFVFFALIFRFTNIVPTDISYNKEEILNSSTELLYANVIDTQKDALDIRIGMILEASETINLTTYLYHSGYASDLVTGALLKKADEGVKIQIIVDGNNPNKDINYRLLSAHENIDYYIFEPFSLFLPHITNNVYHNKILTSDNKYGLTGGRNISDRFLYEDNDFLTLDSEAFIYGDLNDVKPVLDMNQLVTESIDYKYTKKIKMRKHKNYNSLKDSLILNLNNYHDKLIPFNTYIDNSVKVDNITLVESPLNRFNKEPVVAKTIFDLYEEGDSMVIQSPYITSSHLIRMDFPKYNEFEDITFITNNTHSNPNFMALTGYFRTREKMAKKHNVYEYQGEGSLHGKTISINNNISIIGSLNIDSRSFYLSTEAVVIIIGEEFNQKLNESVNNIISQSYKLDEQANYIENTEVIEADHRTFRRRLALFGSLIMGYFEYIL